MFVRPVNLVAKAPKSNRFLILPFNLGNDFYESKKARMTWVYY